MTTLTATNIDFTKVTTEQIGKCHKVYGPDNKPFYLVENSRGDVDENGDLIEYKVQAIRKSGQWVFTCDCKAGQNGVLCWHVRASLAACAEEKAALKELAAAKQEEEVKAPVIEETSRDDYKRVNGVKVYAPSERKIKAAQQTYQPKAFSILR